MRTEHSKAVKLEISLDLSFAICDNRENQEDDLGTAIEKLVIRGLKAEGKLPQCQ
jgi:hypothetical protein